MDHTNHRTLLRPHHLSSHIANAVSHHLFPLRPRDKCTAPLSSNRVRITLQNEWEWEVETLLFEGVNRNKFLWQVRYDTASLAYGRALLHAWLAQCPENPPPPPDPRPGLCFFVPTVAGDHSLSMPS